MEQTSFHQEEKFQTAYKIHSGISDSCSSILCCDSAKPLSILEMFIFRCEILRILFLKKERLTEYHIIWKIRLPEFDGGTAWCWCIVFSSTGFCWTFFSIQSPDLSFSEFLPERKWS